MRHLSERATTSSLEALQAYSKGHSAHTHFDDEGSIAYFKKAVALDPNFAIAWAELGVASGNTGQNRQSQESIKRAFELKDRASERENACISAHYYDEVAGDADKIIEIYEQWKRTYPRDTLPWDNLALRYEGLGRAGKSLENASEGMRLDPKDNYAYQNLADAYTSLGRFDEAQAVVDQAAAQRSSPARPGSSVTSWHFFVATSLRKPGSPPRRVDLWTSHSSYFSGDEAKSRSDGLRRGAPFWIVPCNYAASMRTWNSQQLFAACRPPVRSNSATSANRASRSPKL